MITDILVMMVIDACGIILVTYFTTWTNTGVGCNNRQNAFNGEEYLRHSNVVVMVDTLHVLAVIIDIKEISDARQGTADTKGGKADKNFQRPVWYRKNASSSPEYSEVQN